MKRLLLIVPLVLTGCYNPFRQGENRNSVANESYLATGQSNMTGVAASPFECDKRITLYVLPDSDAQCTGPAYAFALERLKHADTVILVQCAVGGSSSSRWAQGGDLYAKCLAFAKSKGVTPQAILHIQGESDVTPFGPPVWEDNFISMVNGFRGTWGTVPVIYARIKRILIATDDYDQVRQQQEQVQFVLPKAFMVSEDDFTEFDNVWHMTHDELETLGQRMELAYEDFK